jgi:sphingosine kinase
MDSTASEALIPANARPSNIVLSTSSSDSVFLVGKRRFCCSKRLSVCLVLTPESIFVFQAKNSSNIVDEAFQEIRLCDVIGAKNKINSNSSTLPLLEVYEYAPSKSFFSSGARARKVIRFQFGDEGLCQQWSKEIQLSLARLVDCTGSNVGTKISDPNPLHSDTSVTAIPPFNGLLSTSFLPTVESGQSTKRIDFSFSLLRRKFLVFINPHSGTGRALKTYHTIIAPMFEEACIDVELVITQRANHAKEYLQGDAINFTQYACICVVSGDGLVFEVVNGLAQRPQGDGLELLKKIPLAPIPGGTGNGLAKSILFASNNEPYSTLGSTFVAIKGKPSPLDLSHVQTTHAAHFSFLSLGWGLISDIDILSESWRCLGELRLYLAAVYFIGAKRRYRGRLSMVLTHEVAHDTANAPVDTEGKLPGCDIFADPASLKYRKILEGEFLLVWVVQTSHAAATMHSGPGIKLDDGEFTIYVVRTMSRWELLQLLIEVDSGDHVKRNNVEVYKAKSYCLEPACDGIFSLDGEVVEYGPISGQVLPQAARVMCCAASRL